MPTLINAAHPRYLHAAWTWRCVREEGQRNLRTTRT